MRTTARVLGVAALLGVASGGHFKIESWFQNLLDGDEPCAGHDAQPVEGDVPSGGCEEVQGEVQGFTHRMFTCSEDGSSVKVQYFSDAKCQDAVDYNAVQRKEFLHSNPLLQGGGLRAEALRLALNSDPQILQLTYPDSYKNGECTMVVSAAGFLNAYERYTITKCTGNEIEKSKNAFQGLLLLLFVSFLLCGCMCCIGCRGAYKRRSRGSGSAGNHPLIMATAVQTPVVHTNEFSTAATVAAEWGDTPGRFDGR